VRRRSTRGRSIERIPRRILEIVLEQRSVSDETIAAQIEDCTGRDIASHTVALDKQGLIAEAAFSAGRWRITDAGRAALDRD
jgi:hypothetical protein